MSNLSQETKTPRAFAPLEREVALSRELVANLKEATVLIKGMHNDQIEVWKETEGKKFDTNVIAPIEKLISSENKRVEQAMTPGSGVVIVPSELKEKARILQSMAGTLLANSIKAEKFYEAQKNPEAAEQVAASVHTERKKPGPKPGTTKKKTTAVKARKVGK